MSPILIGWVTASWTPATMLAIVCWAAKPTISPSTAVEARIPVARRFSSVNWLRTIAATTRKTISASRRRRIRSLVLVERETCETADGMEVKLNGSAENGAAAAARDRVSVLELGPAGGVSGRRRRRSSRAVLVAIPVEIIDHPPSADELSAAANAVVQVGQELAFLLVPFGLAMIRGAASVREAAGRLGLRRFKPSALLWILAAFVAYLAFAVAYAAIFGEPKQEDIAEKLGPVAVQVLLIAIIVPICEETCFRGMLFSGLRERMPRLAAALVSGLIFGALHATTGVSAVPPLMVFGVILALLYEKTGSIVPGILLHMLNNSIALLGQ